MRLLIYASDVNLGILRENSFVKKGGVEMSNKRIARDFLRVTVVVCTLLSFLSCIAAIPVAVKYFEEKENYVAKAELPAPAQKVYEAAISLSEDKGVKVIDKDPKKLFLKVTDGKQNASLKAVPVGSDKTEITVTASIPKSEKRQEAQKDLVFRVIHNVCTKLGVNYTITKQ
jgi:hypothetical protein